MNRIKNFKVRKATEEDSLDIFEWRNDPVTRLMSFTQTPVSLENHTKWFSASLQNPKREIYIGEYEGSKIGVVRFDEREDEAEVSINMNPAFRGKKLALPFLNISLKSKTHVIAKIKENNTASLKLFQRAGFKEKEKIDDFFIYIKLQ